MNKLAAESCRRVIGESFSTLFKPDRYINRSLTGRGRCGGKLRERASRSRDYRRGDKKEFQVTRKIFLSETTTENAVTPPPLPFRGYSLDTTAPKCVSPTGEKKIVRTEVTRRNEKQSFDLRVYFEFARVRIEDRLFSESRRALADTRARFHRFFSLLFRLFLERTRSRSVARDLQQRSDRE